MEYLAEKGYYSALLGPSLATISGPFSGAIQAEVGDLINFASNPGGKIGKGIVTGIRISVSPTRSTIDINLNSVTIGENEIK